MHEGQNNGGKAIAVRTCVYHASVIQGRVRPRLTYRYTLCILSQFRLQLHRQHADYMVGFGFN